MDPLIRSLMRPEAYPHPVERLELLETHISWVILTGPYAYKLKKPVDFGFVNFTTLERRERFCHEELRLNGRMAPDLYRAVVPVFGPREAATLVGDGEPVEYAVQMQQFPHSALLPAALEEGRLQPEHLDRFAVELARFQRTAAVADGTQPFGDPDAVRAPIDGNFAVLTTLSEQAAAVRRLQDWSAAEFERLRPVFVARKQSGRVREGHGDLHLGNMVLLNGVVQAFDGLEFNASLRWIDVVSEVAFLVMDLQERGRPDLGARVLNHWLEETGDYAGLATWRWYFVYRALVRAKVAALRLKQPELSADDATQQHAEMANYLALAERWTQPRPTAVLITHGVSGTGKSVVSERICERFGAVRMRSDIERKRLFGQWGDPVGPPLTGSLYAESATDRVYRERLSGLVPHVLAAGFPVIVDATFLRRELRDVFAELAARLKVPFVILDVRADLAVLRSRLLARQQVGDDPSDADACVLDQQLQTCEPLTEAERRQAIEVRTDRAGWWNALASELVSRSGLPGA
ncbi:MAG TPA: AAA family ATPase [Planctomycetaceae bacterium]|nr:AAA family ATPase [Planctomycetaceae bacterium]